MIQGARGKERALTPAGDGLENVGLEEEVIWCASTRASGDMLCSFTASSEHSESLSTQSIGDMKL